MIDDLLSSARLEPLAPEPGASAAAWEEVGRRRRRRTLRTQLAACVGVVVLVMVGLLPSLDGGGRVAELDVAGRETNADRVVESPALLEAESEDDSPVDAGRGSRGAEPGSGGRAPFESEVAPAPAQSRPGASAPSTGRPKPPVERTRYETVYIGCLEWCLTPSVVREGDVFVLTLDLCVAVGARARRFSYATTQEVDMWVATSEPSPETLWTWSLGQQFAAQEHHLDISAGECVRWIAKWDGTDERGEPLPAGNYRLFTKSLAEQVAPNSTTETTFQIP
ncbi:MAG TPA: BsuPI-related putative proteinase inhibitor [Acidimicrobiales bacterium]|nr:BsuPI-related putative proteinase inhibitor [Acidimicrobiales bacterium]